jgi:hypothetical protein
MSAAPQWLVWLCFGYTLLWVIYTNLRVDKLSRRLSKVDGKRDLYND